MHAPAGVDRLRALLLYDGAARELVAGLKYRNARAVVAWLVAGMSALAVPWSASIDLVTWAPTTADRRRDRGFDQAELLARGIAREIKRPVTRVLERRRGPPQTGRPAHERASGVEFTCAERRSSRALGDACVLVVDDVTTTGATLAAAAHALRGRGARSVVAITAASTPLKLTEGPADA